MSIDSLSILKGELPQLFQNDPLPENWCDDFIIVGIDNPEVLKPEASADCGDLAWKRPQTP
jgi:hypothetical protein